MQGEATASRYRQGSGPSLDPGKTAILSIILAVIGRGLGYIRTLIVAYFFGVTPIMDAFAAAMGIVELFTATTRSSLQMALLPQLAAAQQKGGQGEARLLMGFVTRVVLVLTGTIAIFIIFSPRSIVKAFAYGFTGPVVDISALTLQLLSIYLVGYTGYYLYSIWAYNKRRYLLPSLLEAILNVLTVFSFLLIISLSEEMALPLSIGLAWVTLLIAMMFLQRDFPWKESKYMAYHVKPLSKSLVFCLGLVGSGALYQATDRFFASLLPSGSVAVINYAIFLLWVPVALLEPAFQIFYADIVYLHLADPGKARERMVDALSLALYYGIPISAFFLIFSPSTVKILFGYGAFDSRAVGMTAACLAAYGFGFAFTAMNHLLWRYAQASGRIGSLVQIAYLSVFINVILDWGLSRVLGVVGIAVATTIVTTISLCLFIWKFLGKEFFVRIFKRGTFFIIPIAPLFIFVGLIPISSSALKFFLGILIFIVALLTNEYLLRKSGINLDGTPIELLKKLKRR